MIILKESQLTQIGGSRMGENRQYLVSQLSGLFFEGSKSHRSRAIPGGTPKPLLFQGFVDMDVALERRAKT